MGLERILAALPAAARPPRRTAAGQRRRSPWRFLAVFFVLGNAGAARAHASWADGSPVPDWVTKACCGPDDAHHLRPDQVHRVADGFLIDGYPRQIYDAQVLPSPDGEYWAFYHEAQDAEGRRLVTSVFCFFAPSWG